MEFHKIHGYELENISNYLGKAGFQLIYRKEQEGDPGYGTAYFKNATY